MLGWRVLISAILIPAAVGLLVLDAWLGPTAPVLLLLCTALAFRSSRELIDMLRRTAADPRPFPVGVSLVLLLVVTWLPHWLHAAEFSPTVRAAAPELGEAFSLCVLLLMGVRVWRFRESEGHLISLAAELLVVTYAGLLLCITVQLRWLGPESNGYLALGSLLVSTKMGDVGAYTAGRLFGRNRLAPHLSPGKTWEGGCGALAGGVLGATLWFRLAAPWFGLSWHSGWWGWAVVYGLLISAMGLIGDLCESLIKREARVKDSATLLPGFGGLLDLLDSVLYAGPVAVMFWKSFLESIPS